MYAHRARFACNYFYVNVHGETEATEPRERKERNFTIIINTLSGIVNIKTYVYVSCLNDISWTTTLRESVFP